MSTGRVSKLGSAGKCAGDCSAFFGKGDAVKTVGGPGRYLVTISVQLTEDEIRRIGAILSATGEDTSVSAFVAVGAVHYLESEENKLRASE